MPPRLARLLAVVGALALIGGAFVLRDALAGDDDAAGDPPAGDAAHRVLCDADLPATCEALAAMPGVEVVEVRTGGEVLAELADGEVPFDAWLTLDPMPGVLDEARRAGGAPEVIGDASTTPVASSGLALLGLDGAGPDCPDGDWGCVVDAAASIPIGIPTLATSTGTLVLAAAAAGAVGSTDFGIQALDRDDLRARLRGLRDSAPDEPVTTQAATLVTQRGRYRAVVTTRGRADTRVERSPDAGLAVAALTPAATVGVVLAPLGPQGAEAVAALAPALSDQTGRDALAADGWEGPPAGSSGLPDPGVVYALKEEMGR